MLKGLYILDKDSYDKIYGPEERADIAKLADIYAPLQTADVAKTQPGVLKDADIIFSGWGAPRLDAAFLKAAPRLKAVFYGAGSVRGLVTPEMWDRDVVVVSAWAANGVPVAEYTVSQILFCLKQGWFHALEIKRQGRYVRKEVAGAYRSTVGIVSLGMIGRLVCSLLKSFDLRVMAYDPCLPADAGRELGVTLASLDDVFAQSDVISLHTPWLKETEGMIQGRHFEKMKPNASFINTARGAVVNEKEMIEALKKRSDITAVLDVTHPEPPAAGSPLYTLPNVVLTPHIAGSMDKECRRMGRYMVEEFRRYLHGEPLKWRITKEKAETMA
jgi:phosphoglycerate dehydrogenase-like enzyme